MPLTDARMSPFADRLRALTNPGTSSMRLWFDRDVDDGFVVVAQRENVILGWLLAFVPPPPRPPRRYYQVHVFVSPDARRMGIGKTLLREACRSTPHTLRAQVHDAASCALFHSDEFSDRVIIDWHYGGDCRECGGHGRAIGLVDGELRLRPCGSCRISYGREAC